MYLSIIDESHINFPLSFCKKKTTIFTINIEENATFRPRDSTVNLIGAITQKRPLITLYINKN